MKKVIVTVVITVAALFGCTSEPDKELELQNILLDFQDSIINEDRDKLIRTNAVDGVLNPNQIFWNNTNYISFETITVSINDKEATVELKLDFEEQHMYSPEEYIQLTGLLEMQFQYTDDGWLLTNIETELDPSSTMPPYK